MQEYFCFDGAKSRGDGSVYLYNEQFDDSSCLYGVAYVLLHDNGRSKRLLNFSYRQPLARIPKQHHIFKSYVIVQDSENETVTITQLFLHLREVASGIEPRNLL